MKIRVGHFFPGGAVESNENELRIVYIKSNEEKTADRERSAGKWYTVDKPISQTGIIGPTPSSTFRVMVLNILRLSVDFIKCSTCSREGMLCLMLLHAWPP